MPEAVVDEGGTIWIVEGSAEGVIRLVRGWGMTLQRKFAVFGREKLRKATAEEWNSYVRTV